MHSGNEAMPTSLLLFIWLVSSCQISKALTEIGGLFAIVACFVPKTKRGQTFARICP